jgi:hypothetical protein
MLWALPRYDVFVFGFRNSFLVGYDLPLLKLMGKRVICVFHGSDSRPSYIDGALPEGLSGSELVRINRRRLRVLRRVERWADHVVCNPLSAQLHSRPVVVFQRLGVPISPSPAARDAAEDGRDGGVRVMHAPSHLKGKGTALIREMVRDVRRSGRAVEYVELVGRPNAEVQEALRSADVVVDQLYSDTNLAGLGAEAAWWGAPTIVGGYGHDVLAGVCGTSVTPPAVYCRPEEVGGALIDLIDEPYRRRAIGAAARDFARREWSREAVAARFVRLMCGDAPGEWMFDPTALEYVHGALLNGAEAARRCRLVLEAAGPGGFGITANPGLLAQFEHLASHGVAVAHA